MNKKMIKSFVFVFLLILVTSFVVNIDSALAQTSKLNMNSLGANYVANQTILGNTDPRTVATRIINISLGLLAVITVAIILVGGFKWMTAMGNEEKASDARKLIFAGVIGLAIVLAAWGVATFVLSSLINATV